MEYKRVHDAIIDRARSRGWSRRGKRKPTCLVEEHHIIPRSLGGTNIVENKVCLTPREHYIVHKLLAKIYTGVAKRKMVHALHRMVHGNEGQYSFISSRECERLKLERAQVLSVQFKDRVFSEEHRRKIVVANTGRKYTEEHRRNISDALKGRKLSEEHRRNKKNAQTPMPEHVRKKISEANYKRWKAKKEVECPIQN